MLALAGFIFANALLLQDGRHPSPLFAPRAHPPPDKPAIAHRDVVTEAVQAALRDRGLYAGPVDGVAGPQTAAAIMAFEAAAGLPQTGRATAPLLTTILTPAPPQRPANPEVTEPAEVGSLGPGNQVAAVQSALSRAAYGQITPDGVLGPQTRDAIRRFQADHGLPATGEISDALVVELRAAGALEGDWTLRLRTDFFISALRRRAEAAGAYVSVARRGADEAGAIFVVVDHKDGRLDLYGPAPQSVFGADDLGDRRFSLIAQDRSADEIRIRMEQEVRFDPDLWLIDIEDRAGRAFLDIAADRAWRFT